MLQQSFETSRAVAVTHTVGPEKVSVLALLDWDHLPHEFCRSDQKFRVSLLAGQDCDRALEILVQLNKAPDILIVDEDFFGSPEAAADACTQIRRFQPHIHIIAIESEMWEGESVLASFGLCHEILPAKCGQRAILGKLETLN